LSRVLLIRHAAFDGIGRVLAGRARDVRLNAEGLAQAERLARALDDESIAVVYSSPQPRALATAEAVAAPHGLQATVLDAFDEIDFGNWTGREIASLDGDATWHAFNTARSTTRIPGGELLPEVQARAVHGLLELRRSHGTATVAVVSHADVIRAVIAGALAMPIDAMLRLTVDPASVSAIALGDGAPRLLYMNRTAGSY
jgi:broad specificity phosphatase PhoE